MVKNKSVIEIKRKLIKVEEINERVQDIGIIVSSMGVILSPAILSIIYIAKCLFEPVGLILLGVYFGVMAFGIILTFLAKEGEHYIEKDDNNKQ